jgi:NADPH-dependent curcumin reductase CurA
VHELSIDMTTVNRQWRVARYPQPDELIGRPHFSWTKDSLPVPGDGEFLVRTICLAPGPAQRGYLEERQAGFYGSPIPLGDVMRGRGIGEVVESNHAEYKVGDIFVGSLGWQDYSVQQPEQGEFVFSTRVIKKPVQPLSLHLGILGQAGGTAYFGLSEGGQIKAGDNVLISAAAGGVGSVAGQIARIKGAEAVVGMASSDEKCHWLCEELGFSAAINYRSEDVNEQLAQLFPNGVDLYFDNVGGEILDVVLNHLAMQGRIALSGFISTQYADAPRVGPVNYTQLLFKRAQMRGFVYFDYWDRYDEAEAALSQWYESGKLINSETIDDGLEEMPESLASLFTGGNRGIKICRVSPDP